MKTKRQRARKRNPSVDDLMTLLVEKDKGVLKSGGHTINEGEFCYHELQNVILNPPPVDVRLDYYSLDDCPSTPDMRDINDGRWASDKDRTEHLIPVMAALWDWNDWSEKKKMRWEHKVFVLTFQRILAEHRLVPSFLKVACAKVRSYRDINQLKMDALDSMDSMDDLSGFIASKHTTIDQRREFCKILVEATKVR